MNYWLFKTEPAEFSIDHLEHMGSTRWDGIRNYQARNLLRDQVTLGDQVLIYHSSCKPTAIVGIAEVISDAYPDPSQFDANSSYFDVKYSKENPRWFCLDIRHKHTFKNSLPLAALKQQPSLKNMVLLKQGRLSIQPVTHAEFALITNLTT